MDKAEYDRWVNYVIENYPAAMSSVINRYEFWVNRANLAKALFRNQTVSTRH